MAIESARGDGRGHWPKGRRRSPDRAKGVSVDTDELVAQVAAWVHDSYGRQTALSSELGVDRRNLWEWTTGAVRPGEEHAKRLYRWLRQQIAAESQRLKDAKAKFASLRK